MPCHPAESCFSLSRCSVSNKSLSLSPPTPRVVLFVVLLSGHVIPTSPSLPHHLHPPTTSWSPNQHLLSINPFNESGTTLNFATRTRITTNTMVGSSLSRVRTRGWKLWARWAVLWMALVQNHRAKTGQSSRAETLGVSLNHKSNLVPSGSNGPPHHILSVGLCEAMGISTLFSLEREWKPTTDKTSNHLSCGRVLLSLLPSYTNLLIYQLMFQSTSSPCHFIIGYTVCSWRAAYALCSSNRTASSPLAPSTHMVTLLAIRVARFPPHLQHWQCCMFFTVLIHSPPINNAL